MRANCWLGTVLACAAVATVWLIGCGQPPGALGETGTVQIAITQAPSDVACVRITAVGQRTTTQSFAVTTGASTVLQMSSVPVGAVSFAADAFSVACTSVTSATVPTWVSDAVTATVMSSVVANVTLVMHKNARAMVSVDFPDGGACNSLTNDPLNCGACGHSCLGGACQNGICLPQTLGTVNGPIGGLAVNASTVFTFCSGAPFPTCNVYAVPKTGGTVTTIASVPGLADPSSNTSANWVGATSNLLLFQIFTGGLGGSTISLYSCNPSSCASSLVTRFSGVSGQGRLACNLSTQRCLLQTANAHAVLVSTPAAPTPVPLSPPLDLATGTLTIANGLVYAVGRSDPMLQRAILESAAETGALARTRLADRGPITTANALNGPLFVTSSHAFVQGPFDFGAAGGGVKPRLFAIPLPLGVGAATPPLPFDGGTALATNAAYYADDKGVYWFGGNSQLVTCPLAGCGTSAPRAIANASSTGLVGDGQALYWISVNATDGTGRATSSSIMKLAL